jgi:IS1 family transposase
MEGESPMANVLPREKQLLVLKMLCDGASIRAVERVADVHRDTIMRLMVRFGESCQTFLDATVRNVDSRHLEIDEQWTWVSKKQGKLSDTEKLNEALGDQYLFLALDQRTKLIACHQIGKRTEETTRLFVAKLANRIVLPESPNVPLEAKPQFSTDGFNAYPNVITDTLGSLVQHGVIIKNYQNEESGRYAPPDISHCDRRRVQGIDDLMSICTSHIERFNCTTRQFVKRFCRLTLAFSKKLRNLEAAVSMHIANYNFCWQARENGKSGKRRLPAAMQAGIVNTLWSFEDLYDAVMAA